MSLQNGPSYFVLTKTIFCLFVQKISYILLAQIKKCFEVKVICSKSLNFYFPGVADTPSPQIGLIQSPMQHHATTTPTMQPSGDGRRSKTRTSINPQQLEVLMQIYNQEQRPSKQTREELMAKTGLEMKVITCLCW